MLEKEQRYADSLRSELAKCTDPSNEQRISRDLSGAKHRICTIQEQLEAMTSSGSLSTLNTHTNNDSMEVPVSRIFVVSINSISPFNFRYFKRFSFFLFFMGEKFLFIAKNLTSD